MAASTPHRWRLPQAGATRALGAALARSCPPASDGPRLLFLSGELGAGKTTLAAAMLEALGVTEPVRSPSYALLETYPIPWGLAIHLDCYRLSDADELEQLGLRDEFLPHRLWLIEWPERAAHALPAPDLHVQLAVAEQGREVACVAASDAGRLWLERLLRTWPYVANKA